MRRIDILVTSEVEGGTAPFHHDGIRIDFHKWTATNGLPLLEGSVWAFIDLVLPHVSGLEICRRLRCDPLTAKAHLSIILDEDDLDIRRRALRAGADDYIVGPVSRTALLDRVLSAQDREADTDQRSLALGGLTIDLAAFQARWRDEPIPLMPNEFRLLRYFMLHPGRVLSKSHLAEQIYDFAAEHDSNVLEVYINRLRRKLGRDLIATRRGQGYVFGPGTP